MVAFIDMDQQVMHTLTTGKWPLLKELHVDLRPYPKWELSDVVSWQAVEQLCESMCRQKWPDLEHPQCTGHEDAYGKGWFRFGLLYHDVKLKFERRLGRTVFGLGLGDSS